MIHTKSSIDLMRKLAEMLLVIIFLLVLVILAVFLIFTANNICSFVFAIVFVNIRTYLEDLRPQTVSLIK